MKTKVIRNTPFRCYLNRVINTDGEPTIFELLSLLWKHESFENMDQFIFRAKGYRFREMDIHHFLIWSRRQPFKFPNYQWQVPF